MKTFKTVHVLGVLFWCYVGCALSQDTVCRRFNLCTNFIRTSENGDVIRLIPKLSSHLQPQNVHGMHNLVCKVPDCLSSPCLNEGTCMETTDGYDCLCPDRYHGEQCEGRFINESVIRLLGGNSREGRVAFNHLNQTSYFLWSSWTMDASHLVCRYLGFTGAFATLSDDWYSDFENSSLSGALGCPPNPQNITECWYISNSVPNSILGLNVAVVCCEHEICGPVGRRLREIIPDAVLTESSCFYNKCNEGRINGPNGWIYNSNHLGDTSPWVQISFGVDVYLITGVVTQGQPTSGWVTSYYVSFISEKNVTHNTKVFPGNFDRSTKQVTNILRPPIFTSNIRIHPNTRVNRPNLRFDFIGIKTRVGDQFSDACEGREGVKLGVEDGRIGNNSMTASSLMDVNHTASYARLNLEAIPGITSGAWMPDLNDTNPWLKIDLNATNYVTAVITQGRDHPDNDHWTTSFSLSFSTNDTDWKAWEECGIHKIFSANYDRTTPVTSLLSTPVVARLVRIHPLTYRPNTGRIALRCEILGYPV